MNTMTCQTCPTILPRGLMHIRTRSFKQVAVCPECHEINARLASIVRAVREGVQAEVARDREKAMSA